MSHPGMAKNGLLHFDPCNVAGVDIGPDGLRFPSPDTCVRDRSDGNRKEDLTR